VEIIFLQDSMHNDISNPYRRLLSNIKVHLSS